METSKFEKLNLKDVLEARTYEELIAALEKFNPNTKSIIEDIDLYMHLRSFVQNANLANSSIFIIPTESGLPILIVAQEKAALEKNLEFIEKYNNHLDSLDFEREMGNCVGLHKDAEAVLDSFSITTTGITNRPEGSGIVYPAASYTGGHNMGGKSIEKGYIFFDLLAGPYIFAPVEPDDSKKTMDNALAKGLVLINSGTEKDLPNKIYCTGWKRVER